MGIRIVLSIIIAVVGLSWVIGNVIALFRRIKRKIVLEGFTFHVQCEKCEQDYDVDVKDFVNVAMSKSVSVTKTKMKGPVLEQVPHYKRYSKKFMCPYCGKKHYAYVKNINEYNAKFHDLALLEGLKGLAVMVVGGFLIMSVFRIPCSIVDKANANKLEQKQQEQVQQMLDDMNTKE